MVTKPKKRTFPPFASAARTGSKPDFLRLARRSNVEWFLTRTGDAKEFTSWYEADTDAVFDILKTKTRVFVVLGTKDVQM